MRKSLTVIFNGEKLTFTEGECGVRAVSNHRQRRWLEEAPLKGAIRSLLRRAYLIFCVNAQVSSERNPFLSKLNGELV